MTCVRHTFREITTPDVRSKCRNPAYYLAYATVVKSLQKPAWVFRGKVVSHMGWKAEEMHALQTNEDFRRRINSVVSQKVALSDLGKWRIKNVDKNNKQGLGCF